MFKGFAGLLALSGVWVVFTGRFTDALCPFKLHPPRVVVKYGDSASVNCNASCTDLEGMGWEATYGGTDFTTDVSSVTWTVENLTDWTIQPTCYISQNGNQNTETLPVVLYKTPDSVSIGRGSDTGPVTEGKEYPLICDIKDIAPVLYLTVRWFKGNENINNETFDDPKKTPVNLSPRLNITPSRDDNGAQYTCVAELDLGPEGPQPTPTMTSERYHMSVYYPTTFLNPKPETLELEEGDEITLNCSATGNPPPVYRWQSSHPQEELEDLPHFTSTSLHPGIYNCTASNLLGVETKKFIVNAKSKGDRTTFWAIFGAFLGLVLLIVVVYGVVKMRAGKDSII